MNQPASFSYFRSPTRLRMWGETAVIALMLMDIAWVSAWYQALNRSIGIWESLGLAACILFASHYLGRALELLRLNTIIRSVIAFLWLLTALLVSMRLVFFPGTSLGLTGMLADAARQLTEPHGFKFFWHTFGAGLLIWRGITLSRRSVDLLDLNKSFRTGLLMFALYGVAYPWEATRQALPVFYGFLFFTLVGMSAGRVSSLGDLRGGRLPSFGWKWAASILASALLAVSAGIFLGWAMQGAPANIIAQAFLLIIFIVLALIGVVLSPVLIGLYFLFRSLGSRFVATVQENTVTVIEQQFEEFANVPGGPDRMTVWLHQYQGAIILIVLLLILALIILGLRARARHRILQGEDSSTTIGTVHARTGIENKNARGRYGSINARKWLNAARIRRMYAQLCDMASRLDTPRPPALTPLEYLPRLVILFPGEENGLRSLTTAYINVRYGELPETLEDMETLLAEWGRIQTHAKKLLRERRIQSAARKRV